ncbi:MAG TPA: hypothetical protein VJS13_10760 [Pyrinomonadaceae bacterium]|nr:hypothetical protein [Pyrinomonadaceae bacterium]
MIGALRLMLKQLDPSRVRLIRFILPVFVASILLLNTGCGLFGAKRKIQVPQLLQPLAEANKDRLVQEVNRWSNVKSIHGKVDIQFEDTSFASSGIADQYRLVDGTITLQRPGKILLQIQFTFVDIAQMASDGEHFTVAVLRGDEKYKRFVKGTNSAVYPKLDTEANHTQNQSDKQKQEKQTVSALSNLRPQHLTDAFMMRPIDTSGPYIYVQSEFFQEEPDTRPRAKKSDRIMRGYYLLEEFSQAPNGDAKMSRRFWFDRVNGIRLARVQSYDDRGRVVTDVAYYNEKVIGNGTTASLPSRIEITRPQDQYKLSMTYQDTTSVELNREYGPKAFLLENKWQLPEIDLDAQNKKVTANQ